MLNAINAGGGNNVSLNFRENDANFLVHGKIMESGPIMTNRPNMTGVGYL